MRPRRQFAVEEVELDHLLGFSPNCELVTIRVREMEAVATREFKNRFYDSASGGFDAIQNIRQISAIENHQWSTWCHRSVSVEPALHMTVREFAIVRSKVRERPTKCLSIEIL